MSDTSQSLRDHADQLEAISSHEAKGPTGLRIIADAADHLEFCTYAGSADLFARIVRLAVALEDNRATFAQLPLVQIKVVGTGKPYRCACGGNVFRKIGDGRYVCNACGAVSEGEP